ncbi:MAG: insulinase family protein [Candidatus Latescibacteria bacterium]|nr:insulinase family protein [bacterium]MBD3423809.1 insulinase family protein [Candidatus Latescibacterota bacterium]
MSWPGITAARKRRGWRWPVHDPACLMPRKESALRSLAKLFPPALIIIASLSAASLVPCCTGTEVQFQVTEEMLDNGLRVLLHEDHSVPVVSYQSFYRVGSRNEEEGIRGISQLIEHMMFRGTARFGAGVFDSLLENNGGSAGGYTTKDMTVYNCEFHRDLLARVIELEADRMRNLLFGLEDIEREKKIISEERLRSVDNSVRGRMRERLFALAFRDHPYRYPAIGTEEDIMALTREDCMEYYRSRYRPSNVVVVAAGDFDTGRALELIRRHYGPIPAGQGSGEKIPEEPAQSGERRDTLDVKFRVPVVKIGFRAPPAGSEDIYPLDMLQMVLDGGRDSRLNDRLVKELNIATEAGTFFPWRIDPALFIVTIRMREGQDPYQGVEAFYSVIKDIIDNGVTGREIQMAKKMIEAGYLRGMETISGRAGRIGRYQLLLGDHQMIYTVRERYRQVDPEDLTAVAAEYFSPEKSNVVFLLESGSGR